MTPRRGSLEELAKSWVKTEGPYKGVREPISGHYFEGDVGCYVAGYRQAIEDAEKLIRAHGASKTVIERLRKLAEE